MEVEKIITVRIDVPNPSSVVDIDNFCLEFLNTNYKNKCYADCYITEIKKIVYRSRCVIHTTAPSNIGFVDVKVMLAGKKYAEGFIVSNAEILNIDIGGNIFLKKDNVNMVVKAKSINIFGLTKGHRINVKILQEKHQVFSQQISCLGELYFYPTEDTPYTIQGDLSKEEEEIIKNKVEKIVSTKKKIDEIPSAIYDYFYNLTYPFKDGKIGAGPSAPETAINLIDYAKIKGTVKLGKNHPASGNIENVPQSSQTNISSKFTILFKMLNNYEQNLQCLIDMCKLFEKDREKNSAVWKIYGTLKK